MDNLMLENLKISGFRTPEEAYTAMALAA